MVPFLVGTVSCLCSESRNFKHNMVLSSRLYQEHQDFLLLSVTITQILQIPILLLP